MLQPKVIFLDAVGTLFGVKGSVGEVYSNIAQKFSVEASAPALNQAFFQSFRAAGSPAFVGVKPSEIRSKEFAWWQAITAETFKRVDAFSQFSDFSSFFAELYRHFATAEPWVVYSDVRPALEQWSQLGVQLGVLSNFDSRLYSVLQALDLSSFFSTITISTEVGAAKPGPQIFHAALQRYNCPPDLAWHIGDSFEEDYQAACAIGMKGIWLRRKDS